MKVFLAGAEHPGHRKLLRDVERVSLSFKGLIPRLPKKKVYRISEKFEEDQEILLDCGLLESEDVEVYKSFLENNLDDVCLVTEPSVGKLADIEHDREHYWDGVGDKFLPVWQPEHGMSSLESLGERYERVGVPEAVLESVPLGRLNKLVQQYGVALHGISVTRPGWLRSVKFDSVSTTSWLGPRRYGETIFFDGYRLRRYPAGQKNQARRKYRQAFTHAGFDSQKIIDDDKVEVTRLSIWSWQQLEAHMSRRVVRRQRNTDYSPFSHAPENAENEPQEPDTPPPATRNSEEVEVRPPEERKILPIMSFQRGQERGDDGHIHESDTMLPVVDGKSLRRCDSCFIAGSCPEFKPGSTCAYELPIEVRTKDQLFALLRGVIEMQGQRVAFARLAEELEGGYPDPNLSGEMDRLFKLTEQLKDIQDDRDFLKVAIEARGQAGILSRIFGSEVGTQARELSRGYDEGQTNEILTQAVEKGRMD